MSHLQSNSNLKRRGSAVVFLVILIVIIIGSFIVKKSGVLAKKYKDPNAETTMPWDEWDSRCAAEEKLEGLYEHAEIEFVNNPLELLVNIRHPETNDYRGQIKMGLSRGRVDGYWEGTYQNIDEKLIDVYVSPFTGYYYPAQIRDANGNDNPSQHYFLCKGQFSMMETGDSYVKLRAGDLYVRGWLGEDYMVRGKLFLTSNNKDFFEFQFKGFASERQSSTLDDILNSIQF